MSEELLKEELTEQEEKEVNEQFVEFLHTKGFKAKVKLVIENIKKGLKEAKNRPVNSYSNINEVNLV